MVGFFMGVVVTLVVEFILICIFASKLGGWKK